MGELWKEALEVILNSPILIHEHYITFSFFHYPASMEKGPVNQRKEKLYSEVTPLFMLNKNNPQ
jgi:hypothetical protein